MRVLKININTNNRVDTKNGEGVTFKRYIHVLCMYMFSKVKEDYEYAVLIIEFVLNTVNILIFCSC